MERLSRMLSYGALGVFVLFGLGAKGCGGKADTTQPTISLLTPEELALAKHEVAITGSTTGGVDHVEITIDSQTPPLIANGTGDFWYVLDVSSLPDGCHTVRAKAIGNDASLYAQTPPVSFISYFGAAAGTTFFYGSIRDGNNQPIPGTLVTTVEDRTLHTLSDLTGTYALTNLTPSRGYTLHAAATGQLDTYMPLFSAADVALVNIPMLTPVARNYVAAQYGLAVQPGTAWVLGFVESTSGGVAGVSINLVPPSGTVRYFGPTSYNPTLTTTTSGGGFFGFNVAPGPIGFTATQGTARFITLGSQAAPDSLSFVYGFRQ